MFNHNARWDKNLPPSAAEPDSDALICVTCRMENSRITPVSFSRKNSTWNIAKINFSWEDKEEGGIIFFSVTTNCGNYEISFRKRSLSWRIHRLLSP